MPFIKTNINDLLIFEPVVHRDSRGFFFESYNFNTFNSNAISNVFVQDNQSFSTYGTVRGLHLQKGEAAQAKLVRVLKGAVLDVAVDLRKDSTTFGHHFGIELTEKNQKQLYIPRGFAHGFVVLSDNAELFYKCDNFYNKDAELGIIYNDPILNIDWRLPKEQLLLSEKDRALLSFSEIKSQL